jgi:fructose-1-phosphate kinase PfkB-like protein
MTYLDPRTDIAFMELFSELEESVLEQLFDIMQSYGLNAALDARDRYLDAIRSQADQIKTARIEEKINIAKKMLERFDIDEIAEITGLTIQELEDIRAKK